MSRVCTMLCTLCSKNTRIFESILQDRFFYCGKYLLYVRISMTLVLEQNFAYYSDLTRIGRTSKMWIHVQTTTIEVLEPP